MIEFFLFCLRTHGIKNTDGFAQSSCQTFFTFRCVSFFKRFPENSKSMGVFQNCIVEQLLDLVLENFAYLFIWNFQFINTAFGFSFLRQIPCHKQYAPKIIDAIVYFVVCQLQTDRLFNFLPSNQTLNFVPCGFIRFVNKSFYKVVAAGIDPVRLRLCIKLSAKSVNMVNHIPRTVNIGITKTISIILVFRFT